MKKSILALSILLFLVSLTVTSCKKDPCKKVECNNGTCVDGDCVCNPGFMGAFCDQIQPCYNVNCNDGTCVDGTCKCEPGYSGTNCENYDPCFSITCGPNGTCLNGVCNCDPGYGGPDCDIPLTTNYFGAYNASESCSSAPSFIDNYTAEVKASTLGNQYMIITNLYSHFSASNPGIYQPEDTQVFATVSSSGLDIPTQTWSAPGLENYEVSGTGTVLTGYTFEISFTLRDVVNNYTDNCTVTYVYQ